MYDPDFAPPGDYDDLIEAADEWERFRPAGRWARFKEGVVALVQIFLALGLLLVSLCFRPRHLNAGKSRFVK